MLATREQELQILAKQVNAAINRLADDGEDVNEITNLALADQVRYWQAMTLLALQRPDLRDMLDLRTEFEANILAGLNWPSAPILGGAEVP